MFSVFVIINHDAVSILVYTFVELFPSDNFQHGIAEPGNVCKEFGSMLPNYPPEMMFNFHFELTVFQSAESRPTV